jgi:adenine-specific DNA methylase
VTQAVKRKLIEVALPLEAINRESAREKSDQSVMWLHDV